MVQSILGSFTLRTKMHLSTAASRFDELKAVNVQATRANEALFCVPSEDDRKSCERGFVYNCIEHPRCLPFIHFS